MKFLSARTLENLVPNILSLTSLIKRLYQERSKAKSAFKKTGEDLLRKYIIFLNETINDLENFLKNKINSAFYDVYDYVNIEIDKFSGGPDEFWRFVDNTRKKGKPYWDIDQLIEDLKSREDLPEISDKKLEDFLSHRFYGKYNLVKELLEEKKD